MTITESAPTIFDEYALVELDCVCPAEDNVRDDVGDITDLANSIAQNGLQQPIRVQPFGEDGTYTIIAGHRRRAAIEHLIDTGRWSGPVAVMITPEPLTDQNRVAAMLVENMQRKDLNPLEEAKAFNRLTKEFKFKTAELAKKIGRSSSYVSDRLALLKLPSSLWPAVTSGDLPLSIATELTRVGDDDVVLKLTKAGSIVPTVTSINQAIDEQKAKRLHRDFIKALLDAGIEEATEQDRFGWRYDTELIAAPESPKEIAGLLVPKGAKAYVTSEPWRGVVTVEIRKKLTEKQVAARDAKEEAERSAADRERDEQAKARFEQEAAQWSPEYRAWHDECEALSAAYLDAKQAYADQLASAKRTWVDKVSAKDAARWAMLDAATDRSYLTCKFFGLESLGSRYDDAVIEFCNESAGNLVKVVAYQLGLQNYTGEGLAARDLQEFVAKQKLIEPTLVLPPEPKPTTNESGEDMSDGEWEAMQELRRQEQAGDPDEYTDDDDQF